MALKSSFGLGDWAVHPSLNRLERSDEVRQLEPMLMLVLCRLARTAGEVVSKEELVESVWDSRAVADSAVSRAISELRRALDDDSRAPSYIETIPKSGYRLLAVVTPLSPASPAERVEHGRGRGWAWAAAALLALAVLTLTFVILRARVERPEIEFLAGAAGVDEAPVASLRQLTTAQGLEVFPSYSPDGSRVAYVSDRSGRLEIYLRQLLPGSQEIQLTADGAQNVQPAWSPDGRFIAFHSIVKRGLWLLPALGGEARRLTDFGSDPSWSPDSAQLVFQSVSKAELTRSALSAISPSVLWTVSVNGGHPQQLTKLGWPRGGHGNPRWSPDGERIAFLSWTPARGELWTVAANGKRTIKVDGVVGARSLAWAASGRRLFYSGKHQLDDFLFSVDVSPSTGLATSAPRPLLRAPVRHLAATAQGRLVASRIEQSSDLWSLAVDPATGAPSGDAAPLTRETNYRNTGPEISPDGEWVVYKRRRTGQRDQLWMLRVDGSGNVELTLDAEQGAHAATWLADGRSLFFQGWRDGTRWVTEIEIESRVVSPRFEVPPEWQAVRLSRDASWIAFQTKSEGRSENIWVAPFGSEKAVQVTHEEGFVGFPRWSPDGQSIAVEVSRDNGTQVAVVPRSGGDLRQLTDEPGQTWPGSWSPDGKRILLAARREGFWDLRWISVATGEERVLSQESSLRVYYRDPDWSAQGDLIVFERGEISSDLWEVELPVETGS